MLGIVRPENSPFYECTALRLVELTYGTILLLGFGELLHIPIGVSADWLTEVRVE